MNKKTLLLGSVLGGVAVVGVAGWLLLADGKPATLQNYWNGETELNVADKSGVLPLIKAVQAKDEAVVAYLIEQGADVDKKDRNGMSAVEAAAATGDFSLFERTAKASKMTLSEPMFLDKALDGGNIKIVQFLLDKGANVNATLQFKGKHMPDELPDYKDPRVITPLKKAVALEKADIASLLLQKGADGAEYFLVNNVRAASPQIVKALGDGVKNLQTVVAGNVDLLSYAVLVAPRDTIAYLIDKNAGDVNQAFVKALTYRKDGDKIVLDNVSYKVSDTSEVIKLFADKGARVSVEAMEMMLKKGRNDDYLTLAQCSPNPNALTEQDQTMLMVALQNGYETVSMFKRRVDDQVVKRSLTIAILSFFICTLGLFILSMNEGADFIDLIFEVFSAFGTVGLSASLTPTLTVLGKIVIIILMYIGRIGPLTMVFVFAKKYKQKKGQDIMYPTADVLIG